MFLIFCYTKKLEPTQPSDVFYTVLKHYAIKHNFFFCNCSMENSKVFEREGNVVSKTVLLKKELLSTLTIQNLLANVVAAH